MPDYNTTNPLRTMFDQARGELDYSQHFNDMLAPYQTLASKMQSPYALFRPDSWMAQQHPEAAKILDSMGLAAAMTPGPQGPEGVGGGISRTFQGMVGAQQFRRQQMLQAAMLPYQMLMPQLQARDIMSQTMQRSASAPYELARGEYYMGRLEQADRPRTVPGGIRTDDKGGTWQEIYDPMNKERPTRLFNPDTQQYADQLPADARPSFRNQERTARIANVPGGLLGEAYSMMDSPDPAIRAHGKQLHDRYISDQRAIAGARTGGAQEAPHPFEQSKDFLAGERRAAYGQLTSNMNPAQFQELHVSDPNYWKPGNQEKMYADYIKQQQVAKQQMDLNFGSYQKSGLWQRGVTFQEFISNPQKYADVPANAGVDTNAENPYEPKR